MKYIWNVYWSCLVEFCSLILNYVLTKNLCFIVLVFLLSLKKLDIKKKKKLPTQTLFSVFPHSVMKPNLFISLFSWNVQKISKGKFESFFFFPFKKRMWVGSRNIYVIMGSESECLSDLPPICVWRWWVME